MNPIAGSATSRYCVYIMLVGGGRLAVFVDDQAVTEHALDSATSGCSGAPAHLRFACVNTDYGPLPVTIKAEHISAYTFRDRGPDVRPDPN